MASVSPKPFSGKVIAITGAGRGIARGTAIYLAERGASLSLADVDAGLLSSTGTELKKYPDINVHIEAVDISDSAAVDRWIQNTINVLGRLDGAVNLAGVLHNTTYSFCDIKNKDCDRVIRINLSGVMYCMRAQLKVMGNGGSIVNASSVAALTAAQGVVAYAATKAGVIALSKAAAREFGSKEIRVNAIAPSGVDTPMVRQLSQAGMLDADIIGTNAIKRFAKTEEAAALIAFLLGDESKYITGDVIRIDGGFNL